jgi:hypothetical protein
MESSAGWRRVSCGARRAAAPCWRAGDGRGRGRCAARTGRCSFVRAGRGAPGCGVTHVLLPVSALLRRADTAAVIVSALASKARCGFGFRRIAADLGRPGETVRGWLPQTATGTDRPRPAAQPQRRNAPPVAGQQPEVIVEEREQIRFLTTPASALFVPMHEPAESKPAGVRDGRHECQAGVALLGTGVLSYELYCKDGELLSECVDGWLVSRPILTRAIIVALARHLGKCAAGAV